MEAAYLIALATILIGGLNWFLKIKEVRWRENIENYKKLYTLLKKAIDDIKDYKLLGKDIQRLNIKKSKNDFISTFEVEILQKKSEGLQSRAKENDALIATYIDLNCPFLKDFEKKYNQLSKQMQMQEFASKEESLDQLSKIMEEALTIIKTKYKEAMSSKFLGSE